MGVGLLLSVCYHADNLFPSSVRHLLKEGGETRHLLILYHAFHSQSNLLSLFLSQKVIHEEVKDN